MIIKVKFNCKGEELSFDLDTAKPDRNYDDEEYAYWVVHDKQGFFHEINVYKDDDGSFKHQGTVNTWFDHGRFEDATDPDCVSDVQYTFYDPATPAWK